jgi:hypothetical protein
MSLDALLLPFRPLKGPDWVLLGICIFGAAIVLWEGWQTKTGSDRPAR